MLKQVLFLLFSAYLAPAQSACPNGFKLVNSNKCLRVVVNHMKHLEAETDCRKSGGTIVTIKNAIDNRAVVNMIAAAQAQFTWIGMFCFGNDTTTCYHDDGTGNPTYSNFQAGYPNAQSGGCVYMPTTGKLAGQWVTGPCQVSGFAFVCEVPVTIADPDCTHNFNDYCYYPSHEMTDAPLTNTTFSEAEVICREIGAKLTSIHSIQEENFIKGLYQYVDFPTIFLGAQDYLQGIMEWVDDTRWDYDYSDPIVNNKGACLQMDTSNRVNNGMWSRVDCNKSNYFVCKRKLGNEPEPLVDKETNPKFRKDSTTPITLPDFSYCNTTLYLGPGFVTSLHYPNPPPSVYCTWKLGVLGPYRLGLYFTAFSLASDLSIYDEYGNLLNHPFGNRAPFQTLAPTNIVTMTHDSRYDAAGEYRGFQVSILPY